MSSTANIVGTLMVIPTELHRDLFELRLKVQLNNISVMSGLLPGREKNGID